MYSVKELFQAWNELFKDNVEYLTKLDSVAGDADLGLVMNDGFSSTSEFVAQSDIKDVGMLFFRAGKHFNNVASSSMGTLLSAGFMNAGKKLRGKEIIEDADFYTIVASIAEGVQSIGKAKEGEKTFLDGIYPAERALENITDLKVDIQNAYLAAQKGVEDAKYMLAKHGRIAFRGEGSIGIVDPGTVVALILIEGLKKVVESK